LGDCLALGRGGTLYLPRIVNFEGNLDLDYPRNKDCNLYLLSVVIRQRRQDRGLRLPLSILRFILLLIFRIIRILTAHRFIHLLSSVTLPNLLIIVFKVKVDLLLNIEHMLMGKKRVVDVCL
jgi:hypothetical protein